MWQLVHTSDYELLYWSVGDFDLGRSKQTWSDLPSLTLLFLGINSIDRADVHRLNSAHKSPGAAADVFLVRTIAVLLESFTNNATSETMLMK